MKRPHDDNSDCGSDTVPPLHPSHCPHPPSDDDSDNPSLVLHVANIPAAGTKEDVEAIFAPYAPLAELFLSSVSAAKKTRFAFVTLASPAQFSAALSALTERPPVLQGYRLSVTRSKAAPLKCSECGAVVKRAELAWHRALMHTLRSQDLKRQRPSEEWRKSGSSTGNGNATTSVMPCVLERLRLDSPELGARARAIGTLERVIREFWPGAKVVAFGSYAVGLACPEDDIDLSLQVELRDRETGQAWAERGVLCALKKRLIGTLPLRAGFMGLALDARVPVLSYRPAQDSKEKEEKEKEEKAVESGNSSNTISEDIMNLRRTKFDLCVNRSLGVLNSKLLRDYVLWRPGVVRPFLGAVRAWSRAWGINDSKGGLLNSYAVVLMGIGFLQGRGVLPNLQHGVDVIDKKAKSADGRRVLKGDIAKEGLACYWLQQGAVPRGNEDGENKEGNEDDEGDEGKENKECDKEEDPNFMELFMEFLAYYGWDFEFHSTAVSIREDGGVVRREALSWDAPCSERATRSGVCVVDPFETSFNVARHVSVQRAAEIASTFRIAHSMLTSELCKECVDPNAVADLMFKRPAL